MIKRIKFAIYNFLRFLGRCLYKVANVFYQLPSADLISKLETEINKADSYEPKRSFRWILKTDKIPSFVVKSVNRPYFGTGDSCQTIVTVYDPVSPSMAHLLYDWYKSGKKTTMSLQCLDSVGTIVEEWQYKGVIIDCINFGQLDYSSSEPVMIEMVLGYTSVTLLSQGV